MSETLNFRPAETRESPVQAGDSRGFLNPWGETVPRCPQCSSTLFVHLLCIRSPNDAKSNPGDTELQWHLGSDLKSAADALRCCITCSSRANQFPPFKKAQPLPRFVWDQGSRSGTSNMKSIDEFEFGKLSTAYPMATGGLREQQGRRDASRQKSQSQKRSGSSSMEKVEIFTPLGGHACPLPLFGQVDASGAKVFNPVQKRASKREEARMRLYLGDIARQPPLDDDDDKLLKQSCSLSRENPWRSTFWVDEGHESAENPYSIPI